MVDTGACDKRMGFNVWSSRQFLPCVWKSRTQIHATQLALGLLFMKCGKIIEFESSSVSFFYSHVWLPGGQPQQYTQQVSSQIWPSTFPDLLKLTCFFNSIISTSTIRGKYDSCSHLLFIWIFPEMEVPLNHPFIDGLSSINHPLWVPPFMETLIYPRVPTCTNQKFQATSTARLPPQPSPAASDNFLGVLQRQGQVGLEVACFAAQGLGKWGWDTQIHTIVRGDQQQKTTHNWELPMQKW